MVTGFNPSTLNPLGGLVELTSLTPWLNFDTLSRFSHNQEPNNKDMSEADSDQAKFKSLAKVELRSDEFWSFKRHVLFLQQMWPSFSGTMAAT